MIRALGGTSYNSWSFPCYSSKSGPLNVFHTQYCHSNRITISLIQCHRLLKQIVVFFFFFKFWILLNCYTHSYKHIHVPAVHLLSCSVSQMLQFFWLWTLLKHWSEIIYNDLYYTESLIMYFYVRHFLSFFSSSWTICELHFWILNMGSFQVIRGVKLPWSASQFFNSERKLAQRIQVTEGIGNMLEM